MERKIEADSCCYTSKNEIVSCVITTKNEERHIRNCLDSLKKQTYTNLEIILVDNFSTDNTREIAKSYGAKVFEFGNERSSQRNYGAKVAIGKYLIYLDADMILSNNVIHECVSRSECEQIDAFYIPERIVGEGFWIKIRDFERSFYTGTVIDAVRFLRRDLFLLVNGFDESLIGPEDWDFDRKIRQIGVVGICKSNIFHNEGSFNISNYLKKKSYYSIGITKYRKKWGANDPETIKQTGVGYRLFIVFFENSRWKLLIKKPIYAIAMYYLRLRVALSYLKAR